MDTLKQTIALIKKLNNEEKEIIRQNLIQIEKEGKPKQCAFCGCKLLMPIEKQHKCCWDCHYEGKDRLEQVNQNTQ